MPKRLPVTIICFHIMAIMLVAAFVMTLVLAQPIGRLTNDVRNDGDPETLGAMIGVMKVFLIIVPVLLFASALGLELVVRGLKRRRYWAWIVGLVVCGFLILGGLNNYGITLVLGGLALWGLVDPETVAAFRPIQSPLTSGESS